MRPESTMPRRPLPWRGAVMGLALMVATIWAVWLLDFRPTQWLTVASAMAAVEQGARLLHPTMRSENLWRIADAAVTTFALATAGSLMAVCIAVLLAPFTCETLLWRGPLINHGRSRWAWLAAGGVHYVARLLANFLRTVPYLVWALLLVLVVGLGPLPAALALGLHTGGVLGRLFAGAIDALDPTPALALRGAGASRVGILLFAIIPQVRAKMISLWCYRWEVNLREATVLGMVAAGGLGHELVMAFGQFKYQTLSATLIAIMVLVLAGETVSGWVRRRLM